MSFHVPHHMRIDRDKAQKLMNIGLQRSAAERLVSREEDGNNGAFILPNPRTKKGYFMQVLASDGLGWEHVSVSIPSERRCPTWEEMCYVKDLFWDPEDCVIQYHPPKSHYVSCHDYCLHLWRPTDPSMQIPVPDPMLVGPVLKHM